MKKEVEFDLYVMEKYQHKLANAKRRGIKFELTFQSMKNLCKAKRCYYTGLPLTRPQGSSGELRATDMTIDRIDASKGYIQGNVVACSHAFNQLKSHADKGGLQAMMVVQKGFAKATKRLKEQQKEGACVEK